MQPATPGTAQPYVVTLGTAGGPRWWGSGPGRRRSGIATAVVVGEAAYLVDCGQGAGEQLSRAGIPLSSLRGIFLTHLHSDHTVELAALTVFGFMAMRNPRQRPVSILGPGNRGALPPVSPVAETAPGPAFPDNPTPGTSELVTTLLRAFGTDLTDRMLDSLRPSPLSLFTASDITVPEHLGYHPNDNPCPAAEPFEIYQDELVRVTATLVQHPPVAPAFAFRFDTGAGSVTISGDTTYCPNLVRLAEDTDLLLHEAIDFDWVERSYLDEDPRIALAAKQHHHKSHSSPRQAGQVAAEAGARALALHHLVPGDADPSVWRAARDTYAGPVLVPDDLQEISFARVRRPQPVGEA
ncbi:MBL fold metallo-hydrolase [Amycolatopsis sp. VS8301801F10]|uniref:MBL fold metallo-hydrolase n=1 Tax=Amycolatopsis sp. VS8301801F10 TaxID=2652442 RepID=UPI0038FBE98E